MQKYFTAGTYYINKPCIFDGTIFTTQISVLNSYIKDVILKIFYYLTLLFNWYTTDIQRLKISFIFGSTSMLLFSANFHCTLCCRSCHWSFCKIKVKFVKLKFFTNYMNRRLLELYVSRLIPNLIDTITISKH